MKCVKLVMFELMKNLNFYDLEENQLKKDEVISTIKDIIECFVS